MGRGAVRVRVSAALQECVALRIVVARDVQAKRSPGVRVGMNAREAGGVRREARGWWSRGVRLGAGWRD